MKNSIVDVRCVDREGRQFLVEMQMLWTDAFKSRVLFNASKAYVKQLETRRRYAELQPVYALSLVNQNFEPNTEQFYHHYALYHHELRDRKIDGIELIFVELKKFKPQSVADRRMMVLWLRFLTEVAEETSEIDGELLDHPDIREALEYVKISGMTKEELEGYDQYWDGIRSEITLIDGAERKGRQEGRQEGVQVAVQIIKMHIQGTSIKEIAARTKLSLSEVETILQNAGLIG